MDKLLLLLLFLGLFPFEFFQGVDFQCTILHCIIHNSHRKNGKCMEGNGNCTVEEGPGCRTRDLYFFNERDGWRYNHTELDCSNLCKAWKLFHGGLKVSSFCCKGQDFCNRYRGKSLQWKSH